MQIAIPILMREPSRKHYLSINKRVYKKYQEKSAMLKFTVLSRNKSEADDDFKRKNKNFHKIEEPLNPQRPKNISHHKGLKSHKNAKLSDQKKIILPPKIEKMEKTKTKQVKIIKKAQTIEKRSNGSLISDDTVDNSNTLKESALEKTLLIDSVEKSKEQMRMLNYEANNIIQTPLVACASKQKKTAEDKINFHLLSLKLISEFTRENRFNTEEEPEWQELNFLLFKRYYLERIKVQSFLKKHPIKNPFVLSEGKVTCKQALEFIKTNVGKYSLKRIQKENIDQIGVELRDYYNSIIDKSGGKINLLEEDTKFNDVIFQELWQLFVLTEFETSNETKQLKMCRILQLGFLISELNNNDTISPVTEGEMFIQECRYKQYISKYRKVFQQKLLI